MTGTVRYRAVPCKAMAVEPQFVRGICSGPQLRTGHAQLPMWGSGRNQPDPGVHNHDEAPRAENRRERRAP